MRQQYPAIQSLGLQLVAVGMGDPTQAVAFKRSRNITFPLLSDTSQRVYNSYGLGAINGQRELQSGSVGAIFGEVLKGNFGGIPVGDISQLGGTFLIDQQGIARYVHRDISTSDYPSMSELIGAARKVGTSSKPS